VSEKTNSLLILGILLALELLSVPSLTFDANQTNVADFKLIKIFPKK
jgi:hypothetical protein